MYTIILQEDDFLQFQLYTASKSKRIRNVRIRSWMLLSISFILFGTILTQYDDKMLMYYSFFVGILTLVGYPFYQRWRYKMHYRKHIREHAKNKINKEAQLSFDDEHLITTDDAGEGRFKLSELGSIIEIATHLFIKTKADDSLIIPKSMDDFSSLNSELHIISDKHNIAWEVELDWKWK